jgi:cobalt-precorrin 5A hydrolase
MGLDEDMIIAGIGCRRNTPAGAIIAAIDAAFSRAGRVRNDLRAIATAAIKRDETGISAAAEEFRVPLLIVSAAELESASGRTITRSIHSLAATGLTSLAEAAALAAGGPEARLIEARIAVGPVTCALVDVEP